MDGVVSFFTKYATATPQQQKALEEEFAPILKKIKAGIYGASAIGNILATAGLVEETPGIAASFGAPFLGATLTTIGSGVTAAALGFKIGYDLYKDNQFRNEQFRLLKELGFDDDKARGRANASPEYLRHLQSDLGFNALQIQALAIKHPSLMSADYSAELPNLAQFAKVNGLSTQQVWQLLYGGFANTGDVTSFLSELTTVQGLSNVTADDYKATLEGAARSDNPARARAAQAALDFLRNPPQPYAVGIE